MAIFLSIPILGLLAILQSSIFSQVKLLYGTVDLVLLGLVAWSVQQRVKTAWQWSVVAGMLISLLTAVPLAAVMVGYLLTTGAALFMRRVFWERPLLAMIAATVLGTLIIQTVSIIALRLSGTPIPIIQALNIITLPSALLNLLLAIPIYGLMGDLANWLYPQEIEI